MTHIKRKYVDLNQAGWPSGLRRQTQESHQSRILVHECVRGFDSHSCQKTFWTRWGRALSWQILSYWNVNSRWQSKAKENKRLAASLGVWKPSSLKVHKKEDTRWRHVKHDSTRGFECKSFQIDNTNRLAGYISELKMSLNWKDTDQKEICRRKSGRMAERSKAPDSRNSSVENSVTRVCAWVRFPLLSENVMNTMRQSPQVTNSVILERQFKMTVQSKRKHTTRNVIGWLIAEQFKSAQNRGYPAETCKTRLYARVWMQIFLNRWHKSFGRLHLWIKKFTQLKKHTIYRKKSR